MTPEEAINLLKRMGAPSFLLRHGELVGDVAAELCDAVGDLGIAVNREETVVGALIHDAGKLRHPDEITGPGRQHEQAGEPLLLNLGVPAEIARFCRTHGFDPDSMPAMEDLIVALADKLWRGARDGRTELALIDQVAQGIGIDRWMIFTRLDQHFEEIAGKAEQRLALQRSG
jgi:hypothetical protein